MGPFGTTEIIVIIAVLVLFFGASKIPELARGVGEGIKEFRNASEKEIDEESSNKKTGETDAGKKEANQSKN